MRPPGTLSSTGEAMLRALPRRDSQTVTLPDGRKLGFAEYGHPEGRPLFFFHGFPGSRLEAAGTDKMARRRWLRVIAVDRPGMGLSTFQPQRRITDWPADVAALARHLDLPRFAVMGGSGGAPYALACAHALPRERLTAVGVMAGMGTFEASAKPLIPFGPRFLGVASRHWPAMVRVVTDVIVGVVRWVMETGFVTRRMDRWLEGVERKEKEAAAAKAAAGDAPVDEEVEDKRTLAERREELIHIGFEGFAQGAAGAVQEAQLTGQDWGFKMADITYNPILFWHGTKDANVPLAWARHMADQLPHATFKEYEGETHFTLVKHLDDILVEIVPEETTPGTKLEK
ncbi:Alpha/Beta hydrolase protein [Lasiosphaeris hirsuta]|uniref:Alpha/Beta hydrolase protein n=1 Tax=Lasiosphaeris hirsuta TaxID=260670 RepID=A0AA40DXM2_9PEZI|nr:Alpha/Beta hydrolase protein [Lasiosphaeris hirsuta]